MSNIIDKKDLLYCIFEVWDYKGGELGCDINLTYKIFIELLAEKFENEVCDIDLEKISYSDLANNIADIINNDFVNPYASHDVGFCGKLFKILDGKLIEVFFNEYVEDITIKISKWAQND